MTASREAREPLGAVGTIVFPVLAFVVLGKSAPRGLPSTSTGFFRSSGVPVFVSTLIAISAVLSLVTIISIYREGGILKRLRATPLRPYTILTAHVLVKLALTASTMTLMILVGKRYVAIGAGVPVIGFTLALLLSVTSILSIGLMIASILPTARFAQPIGALILYPTVGLPGIFVSVASYPPTLRAVARVIPVTYSESLLEGIWRGGAWSAHLMDVGALVVVGLVCVAISAKVFRWE
ncbi:MAG: ABC transporter permease [Gemmatimonadaceae bacterium]